MYLKRSITLIFTFFISFAGLCQIEERDGQLLSPTFPGGIVELSELPAATETLGSNYIYENWNLGSVAMMSSKAIKDVPLKYDLYQNYLEISTESGTKVLYSENIRYFEWLNTIAQKELYYNVAEFNLLENELDGFFEIMVEGELILASNKEVQYVSPHYNQALDAGNAQGRYITTESFFYIGRHKSARKLPKKKKDFYLIFGQNAQAIQKFMKATKFGIKHREDLTKIFLYHNTLQPNN
jgi:hypothetical protein